MVDKVKNSNVPDVGVRLRLMEADIFRGDPDGAHLVGVIDAQNGIACFGHRRLVAGDPGVAPITARQHGDGRFVERAECLAVGAAFADLVREVHAKRQGGLSA